MKKLFYLLSFTIFCSFTAKAQTIDTSFIYDFSGNADTLQSEITAVYAEEDIILVAGHVQRTGEPQRFYTAAFDYNGQLLWHKEPQLPAEWAHNELAEFDNLKKYKDKNEYIIGGSIHNTTTNPGYDILQPFIYTFNKDGDSIKFERVSQNSDTTQKLSTLNIDEDNNVLIAGNISDKFALDTISGLMTMDSNGMWYAKYNNQII